MEVNYSARYGSSSTFVNQLRRLMPHGRPYAQRRKPTPPKPFPSYALEDLQLAIDEATKLPSTNALTSPHRVLEAAVRGESFPSAVLHHNKIPEFRQSVVDCYEDRVYGARFVGEHGDRFVTSCKHRFLRVYQCGTSDDPSTWKCNIKIQALMARWTITDFDVSPDGRWLAYASIHHYVHLVDLEHPDEPQILLDFSVAQTGRVRNIWSLKWGHDGREIIVGTGASHMHCHGTIIIYNVHRQQVVASIAAHDDDVNSVCLMQSGQKNILLSGSDDAFVKMWDRREFGGKRVDEKSKPCGVFIGHQCGLTYVSSRDDGRFFLSNGKDQYIKLWDARKCTMTGDVEKVKLPPRDATFDYRTELFGGGIWPRVDANGPYRDDAVMTYGGSHETMETLIRAHFSPRHTTGQKYIYCGSSDGQCVIYDVLTGKTVRQLKWHDDHVRDVSWHPYSSMLTTGSWDGRVFLGSIRC